MSAAGLAPKTIVNVVAVLKLVVASAVDEEGDQIYPRAWNHDFIQLPLVIKEKQNRPTITGAEISAVINSVKERYVVLFALVAGTGLRIGEALAVRTDDFSDAMCGQTHMMKDKPDAECLRYCVKQGNKYALVVGKSVDTLDGHEAELDKYAAQKVTVKGTVKGETVTVESVAAAK